MTIELEKLGMIYIKYATSMLCYMKKDTNKLECVINFKTIHPERIIKVSNIVQIKLSDDFKYELESHIENDNHSFYFVFKQPVSCLLEKYDEIKENGKELQINPTDDFLLKCTKKPSLEEPDGKEFGIEKEIKEDFENKMQENIDILNKRYRDKMNQLRNKRLYENKNKEK